jgi:hypothetical protein
LPQQREEVTRLGLLGAERPGVFLEAAEMQQASLAAEGI